MARRVEDRWGELRSLLHERAPSAQTWRALAVLLFEWSSPEDLHERALPYCQDVLARWDDAIRREAVAFAPREGMTAREVQNRRAAIMRLTSAASLVALECFVASERSRFGELETFGALDAAHRAIASAHERIPLFAYHLLWGRLRMHLTCAHYGEEVEHVFISPELRATITARDVAQPQHVRFDASGDPLWPNGALDALGGESRLIDLCFEEGGVQAVVSLDWDALGLDPLPEVVAPRHGARVRSRCLDSWFELEADDGVMLLPWDEEERARAFRLRKQR